MTATTKTLMTAFAATTAIAAGSADAALIISDSGTSAPTTNVFEEHTAGNTWTRLTTAGKGQTFTAPINGVADGESWGLTAITIQTVDFEVEPTETAPTMRLQIYQWGDGTTNLNSNATITTYLYDQTASFPIGGTFVSGDHVKFDLGETVNLTEGVNYAFYASFTEAGATFRPRVGSSVNASHPGALVNGAVGTLKTNQDLEFYLTGTVPEPGSLALLGLGGLLIGSRRRRD